MIRLALIAALLLPGCKPKEADAPARKAATRVKVNLPPSPEMVEPKRVERYVDGAWTVIGLLSNQRQLLNTEVRVKGLVHQIVRCDAAVATDCELPDHAVLVDNSKSTRRRLIVVGSANTEFASLVQGKAVTLSGYYQQSDPEGLFVRMDGILLLPPKPVEPPEEEEPVKPAP